MKAERFDQNRRPSFVDLPAKENHMNTTLLDSRPVRRNDDDHADNWQPVGLLVRRIARNLSIPTPTVVAALEANRINVGSEV